MLAAWLTGLCLSTGSIASAQTVRVGALKFGTVNWELDVIARHGLDRKHGITVEVMPLASKQATNVAIQGGAVDVVVSDWIWVARQRTAGRDYTFVPYSQAVGGVMVRPDAGLREVADLRGRRLGVAGGPLDKSWLLLRAYTGVTLGTDAAHMVEPAYASPPLLNALVTKGDLGAVLTFWHFSARLRAAGMRTLITVDELLPALGVNHPVPLLGWVFHEGWAEREPDAVMGFLRASYDAKALLESSDLEWDQLRALTKAPDQATSDALRDAYRIGIPRRFGARERRAADQLFSLLARHGGEALVGKATALDPGTFWGGYDLAVSR